MDNRSLSHTKWKCQYHIVFIPKYRKKQLYGKIKADVREIISTLCKYKDVEIIAGAVCEDHVHLSVAIPPKISISNFMGYLKGKSTLMIYDKHPELQSKWNKAIMLTNHSLLSRQLQKEKRWNHSEPGIEKAV